jgi:hypothetical protein
LVLQYISIDEQIKNILVKPLSKMKSLLYLRDMLGLMEMTSLLEREVITPTLGGSTDMLLIYGQSFSSSENGPGWAVTFQSEKWPKISDGTVIFQFGKWSRVDNHFCNENGLID